MPRYQGQGGAVFEIDPPTAGTQSRERFDAQIESGELQEVAEPAKAEPSTSAKPKAKVETKAAEPAKAE